VEVRDPPVEAPEDGTSLRLDDGARHVPAGEVAHGGQ
jgi:hypothetical protein